MSISMSMRTLINRAGCPCLEESARFRDLWLDAVKPANAPAIFFLQDQEDDRIKINIQNSNGLLLCESIPTMVFDRGGVCNFQAPKVFEDTQCRAEGWTGTSVSNTEGGEARFDRLSLEDFRICVEEIKDIWGV